jgi:hypothetical protein
MDLQTLSDVLTHDQAPGAQVEQIFREAGWDGPPTLDVMMPYRC